MFFRQRYVERWICLPLAGEEYSISHSAVASFLRAYVDDSVSQHRERCPARTETFWLECRRRRPHECGKGANGCGRAIAAIGVRVHFDCIQECTYWHRFDAFITSMASGERIARRVYAPSTNDRSTRSTGQNGTIRIGNSRAAIRTIKGDNECSQSASNFNNTNALVIVVRFSETWRRLQSIFASCDWLQRTDVDHFAFECFEWGVLHCGTIRMARDAFVYGWRWLPRDPIASQVSCTFSGGFCSRLQLTKLFPIHADSRYYKRGRSCCT